MSSNRFSEQLGKQESNPRAVKAILQNELQPWKSAYGVIIQQINESFSERCAPLLQAAHLQDAAANYDARIEAEYEAIISGVPEGKKAPTIQDHAENSLFAQFQADLTSMPAIFRARKFEELPKKIQGPLLKALEGEDALVADVFNVTKLTALADLLEIQVLGKLLSHDGGLHTSSGKSKITYDAMYREYNIRSQIIGDALTAHIEQCNGGNAQDAAQAVTAFKKNIAAECYYLIMHSLKNTDGRIVLPNSFQTDAQHYQAWLSEAAEEAAVTIKNLPAFATANKLLADWDEAHPNAEPNIQAVLYSICNVYRTYKPISMSEIQTQEVRSFLHMSPSSEICKALEFKAKISYVLGNIADAVTEAERVDDTTSLQAIRQLRRVLVSDAGIGSHVAQLLANDYVSNFQKLAGVSAAPNASNVRH